jgi:hypothetical protein
VTGDGKKSSEPWTDSILWKISHMEGWIPRGHIEIVDMFPSAGHAPGSKAGLIWRNEKHAALSMLARSP